MTKILSPAEGAVVSQQTERQRTFFALAAQKDETVSKDAQKALDWLNLERSGNADCTFPAPLTVTYETDDPAPVLLLSVSPDFENAVRVPCSGGSVTLENLLADTVYYLKIADSAPRSFRTADEAPRWCHADGLSNIRDAGGWKTEDGHRVRQGCIYRGSEMDTHHTITEDGIRALKQELHIRTDLDLRGEAVGRVTESPAGKDLNFLLIPASAYADFLKAEDGYRVTARRIFEVLADEDNYPIYYHCWGGADRTGTIAFLLGAVLGVPRDDLLVDYELTSLSIWGSRSRESELFAGFLAALEEYAPGCSAREQAESFLRSCGVQEETLISLRRNLLIPDR